MSARRTRFYLDKRNKKFLGVCSGIADYSGIDATLVRALTALGVFFSGGNLLLAYFLIAWIADAKPLGLYDEDEETREFWQRTRVAPSRSIRDVNATFRDVDRRLRDIEHYVTAGNRGLAAEIDRLR